MSYSLLNPLGGSFALDYKRTEATYGHPGGKWALASVEVNDGLADDGANMRNEFEYIQGKQDRHEREFLGFGKVITKSIDTEKGNALYRSTTESFDVDNYYVKGNPLSTVVADSVGKKYSESDNNYYNYRLTANGDTYKFVASADNCSDRAIAFTPQKYTKTVMYEGQPTGLTMNASWFEYYLDGNHGELKSYRYDDKGTLASDGTGGYNYRTEIAYTGNPAKHIFGLPTSVQVKDAAGTVYRDVSATYDTNFANHLTQVTQKLDATTTAVTDIAYDKAGNITQKTLPANAAGQRMWYKYLYDRVYNRYLEQIDDAYGYRSTLENYDYRYGIPLVTRDMNGYTLETTIDNLGRVTTMTAPNEQVIGVPYTLKFEYATSPQPSPNGEGVGKWYAVTKHYDTQNPTHGIETVTFVDGAGRPVQVKKTGVVDDKEVMIVSGRAKYDPFGRVKEAYYPVTEAPANKLTFNPAFDNVTPTKTTYDVLDRVLTATLPDNSVTTMAYSLLTPSPSPNGGCVKTKKVLMT